MPPLPQNVMSIAESVRRALGIRTPLEPDGEQPDTLAMAWNRDRPLLDQASKWFAASSTSGLDGARPNST